MLKEYIARDCNNVFKNENEFSEAVTINGVSVIINLDNDRLSQKIFNDFDGVVIGDILFFITPGEFKKIPNVRNAPRVNDAIMFGNKPCIVTNVVDNMGMYEITLQYSGGGR